MSWPTDGLRGHGVAERNNPVCFPLWKAKLVLKKSGEKSYTRGMSWLSITVINLLRGIHLQTGLVISVRFVPQAPLLLGW